MTDRTQLHHLADRARRGVLLPAEGALLADAVAEQDRRIDTLEAVCKSNQRAYKGAVEAAWEYEATIARALSPEGISAAREALTDEALTRLGRDLGTIHAEDIATAVVRAALDTAPDPETVTITQARHQHLVAGQCTDRHDTHQQHHTEPVTGCPYKGCHPDA